MMYISHLYFCTPSERQGVMTQVTDLEDHLLSYLLKSKDSAMTSQVMRCCPLNVPQATKIKPPLQSTHAAFIAVTHCSDS